MNKFSCRNFNWKCAKTFNSLNVISETERFRKKWLQPICIRKGTYYQIVPQKQNVQFGSQREWTDQLLLELSETGKLAIRGETKRNLIDAEVPKRTRNLKLLYAFYLYECDQSSLP